MEKKLRSIGIASPKELARITNKSYDMALKVWKGRLTLSLKMARSIQEATGASLDFLLN
jgi:hypothetical protein